MTTHPTPPTTADARLESAIRKLREGVATAGQGLIPPRIYADECAALLARLEAADRMAEFLVNLRAASRGVAGYHLNGNIAEWDEFEEMNLLAAYHNPAPYLPTACEADTMMAAATARPAAEGEYADWCPVCGGKDGQHLHGCEDGSEVL